MTTPSTPDKAAGSEAPLWPIAAAIVVILGTPLVLYSLAPTGPIRQGDTVFSEGQQQVHILHIPTNSLNRTDETCLLDPNSPLIVLENSTDEPDGLIKAEVQGNPAPEWPFCPVHAEVQLTLHQVFQKPAVLETVRDTLMRWFGK